MYTGVGGYSEEKDSKKNHSLSLGDNGHTFRDDRKFPMKRRICTSYCTAAIEIWTLQDRFME